MTIIAYPDAFSFSFMVHEWAAESDRSAYVTVGTEQYYRPCLRFAAVRDGVVRALCAVMPDGELVSVVRLADGNSEDVAAVIGHAIKTGKVRYLGCFDGKLPAVYRRYGFVEVARGPWLDEYAPWGWNYARDGRPDYLELELDKGRNVS